MQFHFEEFNKYVEITGYRNISFHKVEAFLKEQRKQTLKEVDIQFFEADFVATEQHLYFAVLNALQAFQNRTNISKSIAMETILYASAQRQIQKSINLIGIKQETKNMAATIIGKAPKQIEKLLQDLSTCVGTQADESTLKMTEDKKARILKAFAITKEEIETLANCSVEEAIVNLVIERVALLATQL
jgi:KEOPS complex subunit Cgi121